MVDETFGGFDYDFVDTPMETSLCKICYYPSREAQLSLCCGHTFCKSCLDGTKKSKFTSKLCPMCCGGEFTSVHNKQVDRLVKSLLVFCSNKKKGCEWQGEVMTSINTLVVAILKMLVVLMIVGYMCSDKILLSILRLNVYVVRLIVNIVTSQKNTRVLRVNTRNSVLNYPCHVPTSVTLVTSLENK